MAEYRQSEIDRKMKELVPELLRNNYTSADGVIYDPPVYMREWMRPVDAIATAKTLLQKEYDQRAAAARSSGEAALSAQRAAEAAGEEQEKAQAEAQYVGSEIAARVAQVIESQRAGNEIMTASAMPMAAGSKAMAVAVLLVGGFFIYKAMKK